MGVVLSVTTLSEAHEITCSICGSRYDARRFEAACRQNRDSPAQPPAKSSSQAAPAPAAPAGEMTKEDKEKAMEAAKEAAKSASKGAY
jgi:hypothetical protein